MSPISPATIRFMGQHILDAIENRISGIITRLHASMDKGEEPKNETLAGIGERCSRMGGETLFELPADHPRLGECRWQVLRFVEGERERFVHVFFTPSGQTWIGDNETVPEEFSRFARAWTGFMTRCAALDAVSPAARTFS